MSQAPSQGYVYDTVPLEAFSFVSTLPRCQMGPTWVSRGIERLLGAANESLHGGYTQTKWVASGW